MFSDKDIYTQAAEIIDGNTVRNVENGGYTFYISAHRVDWGWRYILDKEVFSTQSQSTKDKCFNIQKEVYLNIEKRKEKLICLGDFFAQQGIFNYSFEFLLIDDFFHIIDWDTDDDKKIFEYLEEKKFGQWDEFYQNSEG